VELVKNVDPVKKKLQEIVDDKFEDLHLWTFRKECRKAIDKVTPENYKN
jgi:hypothetical protein